MISFCDLDIFLWPGRLTSMCVSFGARPATQNYHGSGALLDFSTVRNDSIQAQISVHLYYVPLDEEHAC